MKLNELMRLSLVGNGGRFFSRLHAKANHERRLLCPKAVGPFQDELGFRCCGRSIGFLHQAARTLSVAAQVRADEQHDCQGMVDLVVNRMGYQVSHVMTGANAKLAPIDSHG